MWLKVPELVKLERCAYLVCPADWLTYFLGGLLWNAFLFRGHLEPGNCVEQEQTEHHHNPTPTLRQSRVSVSSFSNSSCWVI